MTEFKPTIGLEVHAELKTQTKMFCDSKNDPDEERPNVNICPVCMGHPGTLPTINKAAVKHVLKMGLAIEGALADYTRFDRKNYFYPDLPKGYQISQYQHPLVAGGTLAGVAITRIHLEEDTARSIHAADGSLVDFNRAGIPLMELVTDPVVKSAEEAGRFARELQLLLRYLGAGEANMEKGEMRVEANVSVSSEDGVYGTKVEVKNLNSFRSVERAIDYEIKRQCDLIESGGTVVQETRGWDEAKGQTFSQRLKEESHDYRYFPDPDLPSLHLSELPEFGVEALREELPELPWQRRERLVADYDIKADDAQMFVQFKAMGDFFEAAIAEFKDDKALVQTAANYLTSDLAGLLKSGGYTFEELEFSPVYFASLINMLKQGLISSRGAKDIIAVMVEEGGDPEIIAKEKGLLQESSEESLLPTVTAVIDANQAVAAEYKSGKEASLQFLVGQVMKETKGAANPQVAAELLKKQLS